MDTNWVNDAIFYHIYPLGLCGAPEHNESGAPVESRLELLFPWLAHIQALGANAIYLGPMFQSSSHGYDTIDYYLVDRRLGDNQILIRFVEEAHKSGLKVILDAVFNHVGREFWAFKDLIANGEKSLYRDWFYNIRFGEQSPKGDNFQYESWNGHYSLVKLNLSNPDVRDHLFNAVNVWIDQFGIDGLRLDAADCIDLDFLRELRDLTKGKNPAFWLMGEVVHGDYREYANPQTLDSVTNYECYKGLYNSLNDANYFEIAYSLNRQFGEQGIYREIPLYNFVDNHDVDRVASKLKIRGHLYPLYLLLFTIPGVPSVYYGSEWGFEGHKGQWSDAPLRPAIKLEGVKLIPPEPELEKTITKLSRIRKSLKALRYGFYQQVYVNKQEFVFFRCYENEQVLVALNSANEEKKLDLELPMESGMFQDQLNENKRIPIEKGRLSLTMPPQWGQILLLEN